MAVDLITRRFERLEKAQKQTNETLARIASVLEGHTRLFERMEDALVGLAGRFALLSDRFDQLSTRVDRLTDRVDRLSTAIMRGRTKDLARFDDIDRRLRALERPRPRRRKN